MRNIDLSPLYRTFIGLDNFADLINNASHDIKNAGYPPYNVELTGENTYQITMALAGFSRNNITVEIDDRKLRVVGKHPNAKNTDGESQDKRNFLHKGIAERDFERTFQLGDHIKVSGANMENGMLAITLERETPESKKPRTVDIG
jgi:molecular chaperone IbpA